MKLDAVPIVVNGDMSQATINSIGLDIGQVYVSAIQAVFTGSPVGTLKLQVSCDNVAPVQWSSGSAIVSNPAANVVNWTDYTGSSQTISAAGNFAWLINPVGFRWIRLVYTKTSGSGNLNVTFNGKG